MSDIRAAAAEEVLRLASIQSKLICLEPRHPQVEVRRIVKIVIAWLREHPADELLPPTPEWVTERLGEGEDWGGGSTWRRTWDVGCALGFGFERHVIGGALLLVFGALDECDTCKPIHTRRQFLALCEGLGVEVRP